MAQFRGPKKPVTKECVLIIDTVSGEAVLERISNNIQLKAIRLGLLSFIDKIQLRAPKCSSNGLGALSAAITYIQFQRFYDFLKA